MTTYTAALVTSEFQGIRECLDNGFMTDDEAATKRAGVLEKYRGHLKDRHLLIAEFSREGQAIKSWLETKDIDQETKDALFQMCKARMDAPSPVPEERKKRDFTPDKQHHKQATMAPSGVSELSEVSDMSLMLTMYAQMRHQPGLAATTRSILSTNGGTIR